jgi:hypothetical protein
MLIRVLKSLMAVPPRNEKKPNSTFGFMHRYTGTNRRAACENVRVSKNGV